MRRLAERSPALFLPTQFPCAAWYVTAALNVKQLSVCGAYPSSSIWGYFNCNKPSLMHQEDLFATRYEAVAEAERLLALAEKRHEKAAARLARQRAAVAKLKGGAA